jgi:hypothetical protein
MLNARSARICGRAIARPAGPAARASAMLGTKAVALMP